MNDTSQPMATDTSLPRGLDDLCGFIRDLDFAEVPAATVHQSKRALLDAIAAMVLGAGETDVADISALLRADGPTDGACTVVGRADLAPFRDAMFANATLSQTHDANDGIAPDAAGGRVMHPGRVVVPVALGLAEQHGLDGRELLMLVTVGYEAAGRVRGIVGGDSRIAWVAALMCGRVLGLDAVRMRHAMGMALFHSPSFCKLDYTGKGLDEFFLAYGHVARSGVEAALLADAGFRCPTLRPDVPQSMRVDLAGLGESFCNAELYFKPYPACRSVHPAVEAATQLRREHPFSPDDIASVHIEMAEQGIYTERPIDANAADRILCASHPRYMAACALIDGRVQLGRFRDHRLKDPQVFDLVARTTVAENPQFTKLHGVDGRPTRLTVTLRDGTQLGQEVRHAHGSPKNPMTDDQLAAKLRWYGGQALDDGRADRIARTIFELDQVDKLSELTSLLRYPARG